MRCERSIPGSISETIQRVSGQPARDRGRRLVAFRISGESALLVQAVQTTSRAPRNGGQSHRANQQAREYRCRYVDPNEPVIVTKASSPRANSATGSLRCDAW